MTDYAFFKLCEARFGINRGVYNTIDDMFYQRGIKHILSRRKTIVAFLVFATGTAGDIENPRYKFGHGGLSAKLSQYCLVNNL
ncbi:hypothetical protein CBW46_008550 [Paenibacillus xerothermodurans]|uniref:Uncharacterized protein n=2 Tax=Paenibacillus xerothermodurans TaxID=1977292 RepID=A0A2W1NCZ1_PAEXE|nr:hypothetical protein CBW46_008550 [Paenibacillus xerothermodurans]